MNDTQKESLKADRILIADEIGRETYFYAREALLRKMGEGSPNLTIFISSSGGRVSAALDIYDLLKFYSGRKIAIVNGVAGSSAAIILQACEWRTVTPHATVHIHNVSRSDVSLNVFRDPQKLQDLIREIEANQSRFDQILIARTKKSLRDVQEQCEKDKSLSAEDAVAFGLADQIIVQEKEIKITTVT